MVDQDATARYFIASPYILTDDDLWVRMTTPSSDWWWDRALKTPVPAKGKKWNTSQSRLVIEVVPQGEVLPEVKG